MSRREDEAVERRVQDVTIYVLGSLQEMREHGIVEGGYSLEPKGVRRYHDLVGMGFSPTEDEILEVMAYLQSGRLRDAAVAADPDESLYARAMAILDLERREGRGES